MTGSPVSNTDHATNSRVITIDGPAAGGKSTVARGLAANIGFQYLDTGAVYRSATLAAMRAGIDLAAKSLDVPQVCRAIENCRLSFAWNPTDPLKLSVFLDGADVTREIRTSEVTDRIRYVADLKECRALATKFQRKVTKNGDFVTEGRDQGTEVFPDACLKIYLWASPEVRARRRFQEMASVGESGDVVEIERSIRIRDQLDMSREVGALKRAKDAVEVDTSSMTISEAIAAVTDLARSRLNLP